MPAVAGRVNEDGKLVGEPPPARMPEDEPEPEPTDEELDRLLASIEADEGGAGVGPGAGSPPDDEPLPKGRHPLEVFAEMFADEAFDEGWDEEDIREVAVKVNDALADGTLEIDKDVPEGEAALKAIRHYAGLPAPEQDRDPTPGQMETDDTPNEETTDQ